MAHLGCHPKDVNRISFKAIHSLDEVEHDFSCQNLSIKSQWLAYKVSLGKAHGLAGPISKSDFLIGHS